MTIKQISLFLENKPGQIHEITKLLCENNINLISINVAEASEYGIFRLIADNPEKAHDVLIQNKYITAITPVVAISVQNKVGSLNSLLEIFAKENINVEYMYSILGKYDGLAYIIFKVNDIEKLNKIISEYNFTSTDLGIE